MTPIWAQAALVFGLALIAGLIASRFRLSTALVEILVGLAAQAVLGLVGYEWIFAVQEPWVKTLAGIGAILLTFLAGAELDPDVFKRQWKEAAAIGGASFLVPSHRLLGRRALSARLGILARPARRHCARRHLRRRRLHGDDGIWLQPHRLRQDHSRRLFHHRSRHGGDARPRLRALHVEDAALRRRARRSLRLSAENHAARLRAVWRAAVGIRGEIPAVHADGTRRARDMGGKRSGAAGLSHRHGARRKRRARRRADPAPAHHHHRAADALLFHPRRLFRLAAGGARGAARRDRSFSQSRSARRSRASIRSRAVSTRRTRTPCIRRC